MEPAVVGAEVSLSSSKPWINRNFALLWSGQAISFLGDFIFDTTLVLWIAAKLAAGQSWAPAAVSGALICIFLPTLLGGPIAGVFVDRWDKRRTMLVMDALRAGLIGILLLTSGVVALPLVPGGHLPVGAQLALIYAIVSLCTICQQFFGPARMALIGDIVHPGDRGRASGLFQTSMALAGIMGPPIAGPLLFVLGVQWALGINALSFVVSFIAILLVAAPPAARSEVAGQQANFLRELGGGLQFFFHNRVLTTVLIAGVIAMLGAGALNSLDVFFAFRNLHASPQLYGILTACFGVGTIAGSILATVYVQRFGPARLIGVGLLFAGVGMLVYSRLTSFLPACILLGLVGVPAAGINVAIMPLILQTTPREMLGRVNAVLMPIISLASIGSIVAAGILVSTWLSGFHADALGLTFGPVDTIFVATGILWLLAGGYAIVSLRAVDRSSTPAGEERVVEATSSPKSVELAG
jgi:MFS family permease